MKLKENYDEAEFKEVFTRERDVSYPDGWYDDLLDDIRRMYLWYFEAIGDSLIKNRELPKYTRVYVTARYDDACDICVTYGDRVLYTYRSKPWNFYCDGLKGLKEAMVETYQAMERKLDTVLQDPSFQLPA